MGHDKFKKREDARRELEDEKWVGMTNLSCMGAAVSTILTQRGQNNKLSI